MQSMPQPSSAHVPRLTEYDNCRESGVTSACKVTTISLCFEHRAPTHADGIGGAASLKVLQHNQPTKAARKPERRKINSHSQPGLWAKNREHTMKMLTVIALGAAALGALQMPDALAGGLGKTPRMLSASPLARSRPFPNSLLNNAGDPGDDDTAISLAPALSALCQSFIGQLHNYRNPSPNVDQIRNDSLVLAGTQLGCDTAQNETTIAVNPYNPRNLVSGTNDYRLFNTREGRNDGAGFAYTTLDGGRTWRNVQLPRLTFQTGATGALSDMDSAGDPAVAFGPRNTVYYANLVFSRLNNGSGVVVSKSSDGGLTWGEPLIVHTDGVDANGNPLDTQFFNDKEWITVDERTGTVYLTWTSFGPAGSPIQLSRSEDGGKTWSAPVAVNPASAFTAGGVTPSAPAPIRKSTEEATCS
jgi:hypothetical protein